MLDTSGGVALITDGSAAYKDRSGGWAWVAIDAYAALEYDSGYEGNTTISRMELTGPQKGLNYLFDRYGSCEVLVYSDSEYVVKGATDKTRKRNKNKEYWHWLEDAIRPHEYVDFIHVKGHSGNHWNELADKLAGEARRKGVT